jgi:WG containing repeat
MKRTYVIIALLLWQFMFSQQALVPYRVKDKWGLSDTNGKMVVKADYDRIDIGQNYANGYFGYRKGNMSGVIYNKKEIVSGQFRDIVMIKNKLILAMTDNDKVGKLYNLSGKDLYPEGFKNAEILDSLGRSNKYKNSAKYLLFSSESNKNLKSIFIYDVDIQDIIAWPVKDNYTLFIKNPGYMAKGREAKGKKGPNDGVMVHTFTLEGNAINSTSRPLDQSDLSNEGYLPEPRSNKRYSVNMDADTFISGAGAGYGSEEKERSENAYIKVKEGIITLRSADYTNQYKEKNVSKKNITLPYDVEWVKEEKFSHIFKQANGNKVNVHSVASFKTKQGKYGIVFLDTLTLKPNYDHLVPFESHSHFYNRLNFIAGKKDSITGKTKYGIIDIHEKVVIPIAYDSIFLEGKEKYRFMQHNYEKTFTVLKDGKYGILDIDGKVVLKATYDLIYPARQDDNKGPKNDRLTILKKDGKFGLLTDTGQPNEKTLLVEPVFAIPPGYYIENYQGQKGLMLFGLTDNNGQLYCYARTDGFVYYKE